MLYATAATRFSSWCVGVHVQQKKSITLIEAPGQRSLVMSTLLLLTVLLLLLAY
jgi:hypothetical protein